MEALLIKHLPRNSVRGQIRAQFQDSTIVETNGNMDIYVKNLDVAGMDHILRNSGCFPSTLKEPFQLARVCVEHDGILFAVRIKEGKV